MPRVKIKYSVTTTNEPAAGELPLAELAANIIDKKLWIGNG